MPERDYIPSYPIDVAALLEKEQANLESAFIDALEAHSQRGGDLTGQVGYVKVVIMLSDNNGDMIGVSGSFQIDLSDYQLPSSEI